MNNGLIKSAIISIVISIISVIFLAIGQIQISFFCLLFLIFSLILLIRNIYFNKNPKVYFDELINNILNTYDTILVEINEIPDFADKEIVFTKNFIDMVNIENYIRKPIYFIKNTNDTYDFILMDDKKVYINIIKYNKSDISPLEVYINHISNRSKNTVFDKIKDIDKTSIVKLDNNREVIVYPLNREGGKK